MKQFLEAIEKNPELKAKVEALGKNPEVKVADFIALAKEYGFEITEEDFKVTEAGEGLSDDELVGVSSSRCSCPFVGGGDGVRDDGKGNDELNCVCIFGGGGAYINVYGERKMRCLCVLIGGGSPAEFCHGENGNPLS